MSAEDEKPEAAKPSRFAGMIAKKGDAPRPAEQPQRAAEPVPAEPTHEAPAAEVVATPVPAPAAPPVNSMGSKSLTLRLPESEYERLRAHAFTSRMSHQAILAEALRRYLDAATY